MTDYSGIELIDLAKLIESAGEEFYGAALEHLKDGALRSLFVHLQAEERRHTHTFELLLEGLEESSEEWRVSEDYLAYMRALAADRVFPGSSAAKAAVGQIKCEADAINFALRFEKDTVLYFHELRPAVREEDQGLIDMLVAEERKHITKLHAALRQLQEPA